MCTFSSLRTFSEILIQFSGWSNYCMTSSFAFKKKNPLRLYFQNLLSSVFNLNQLVSFISSGYLFKVFLFCVLYLVPYAYFMGFHP